MKDISSFGDWNQSILIAKDEAFFKDSDRIILSGDAEVRLDLLPKLGVKVYVKNIQFFDFETVYRLSYSAFQSLDLELKNVKKPIKGSMSVNDIFTSNSFVWSSHGSIIGIGGDDTQMQYVVFHLFNFKKILKPVNLKYKNWVIELLPSQKSEERFKRLENYGGYALTHRGCLKKVDDTSFSSKEAEEILSALFLFFSFAKGDQCATVYPVGFDSSDNKVWELWYTPRVTSFSKTTSWFVELYPKHLEDLFFGFMDKLSENGWKDTFRRVLYWYYTANTSNIDSGIILTQTALEKLMYMYFNGNPINGDAAKQLKKLLCTLDIPVCINEDTPALKKLAKEVNQSIKKKKEEEKLSKIKNKNGPSKWTDAPNALIEMRNYLVHPKHKYYPVDFRPAIYETWKLGLWYLELSLLKLCGYSGEYHNRLTSEWVDQIEYVPGKE